MATNQRVKIRKNRSTVSPEIENVKLREQIEELSEVVVENAVLRDELSRVQNRLHKIQEQMQIRYDPVDVTSVYDSGAVSEPIRAIQPWCALSSINYTPAGAPDAIADMVARTSYEVPDVTNLRLYSDLYEYKKRRRL